MAELRGLLSAALADEPPADVSEGNFVREGHDGELDRMRALMSGNKAWLADLERGEQERTGIRSLKVRFTNNFGYYIEITKANLHLVPSDYVRRQTTVGGERYVTEALRQKEREILHAEDNALVREKEILEALIAAVLKESQALAHSAEALAEIDVLAGWAGIARDWAYCRPEIDEGDSLEIAEGRHPVVEQGFRSGEAGGRPGLRPQRHGALLRRGADRAHHGPQHGGQVDLHPPGGAHRPHGPGRLMGPRLGVPVRAASTGSFRGSGRATTSRGATRRSWSR